MVRLTCPRCGHSWTLGYWKWVFTAPLHEFVFFQWRDYRKTKCPNCNIKSWIKRDI